MDVCQLIEKAKCCFSAMGDKYATELSMGMATNEMFYDMLRMDGYISILSRYEQFPQEKVDIPIPSSVSLSSLVSNNNLLSLKTKSGKVCVDIDPDEVNCLTVLDIGCIEEQIMMMCELCKCNCC